MTLQELDFIPGGDLVRKGLADLEAGRSTKESLLLLICKTELERIGIHFQDDPCVPRPREVELYHLLQREFSDEAHSAYNSLIRRMTSFIRCA